MLRILTRVLLGIFLVLAGLIAAAFWVDWSQYEEEVEHFLTDAAGRDIRMDGFDMTPGWTTKLEMKKLTVANTPWALSDHLLNASSVHIGVRIWPLLWGKLHFTNIDLDVPDLALERGPEGKINWDLDFWAETALDVLNPDSRADFPEIDRLSITSGHLAYVNKERGIDLNGTLKTATGDASGTDAINFSLVGKIQGDRLRIDFAGGSFVQLRQTEAPYPIDLNVRLGESVVNVAGTATRPFEGRDLDIAVMIDGPTLAQIYPLFLLPLPDTPPYHLEGALTRDNDFWRFDDFSGTLGDSDLSGWIAVDYARDVPLARGDIRSQKLDLDDLSGLIGLPPDPDETANEEQRRLAASQTDLIPETTIRSDRLSGVEMDINFRGEEVTAPGVPIDSLTTRLRVSNGIVTADPLTMKAGSGEFTGQITLDTRPEIPDAKATLDLVDVPLQLFFKGTDFFDEAGGLLSGDIDLQGSGKTVQKIFSTANGTGNLSMTGGSVSGLAVEALGVDIIESLALLIGGDAPIPIRCAKIEFTAKNGLLTFDLGHIDTDDSLIVAVGNIDLGLEQVDVKVEARAKDFSLIDAAIPIRISGQLADPSIGIGGFDPLPFFEMGEQKDLVCSALVRGVIQEKKKQLDAPQSDAGTAPPENTQGL